jgi:hypothetical protein
MRHLLVGLLCWFWLQPAQAASIMIVDVAKAEAQSQVLARLAKEAASAQQKKTGKAAPLNPQFQEALDLSQSDWRQAVDKVVATLAQAKKVDVVIDASVAKKQKLTGLDATAELVKSLDQQFAKAKFIAP